MSRRRGQTAFTLVELLVVIGVISLLISILLPALERARSAANMIKCAANLRSIGQGFAAYEAENDGYLPVSYNYRDGLVTSGVETPTGPQYGYIHWSSFILGDVPPATFQCPSFQTGGLPAAAPPPGGFEPEQLLDPANTGTGTDPSGQVTAVSGADGTGTAASYFPDAMPRRIAYVLNEGLCGRNKYVLGFGGCKRTYRNVSINVVNNQAGTILATEFVDSWLLASGAPTYAPTNCLSVRPVSPFRQTGTSAGDQYCDPSQIDPTNPLRRTVATDFYQRSVPGPSVDPIQDFQAGTFNFNTWATRLDLVGRNHGVGVVYADKKTNFLYLDGHVETKGIAQTVPPSLGPITPWEWGDFPYSVTPNAVSSN